MRFVGGTSSGALLLGVTLLFVDVSAHASSQASDLVQVFGASCGQSTRSAMAVSDVLNGVILTAQTQPECNALKKRAEGLIGRFGLDNKELYSPQEEKYQGLVASLRTANRIISRNSSVSGGLSEADLESLRMKSVEMEIEAAGLKEKSKFFEQADKRNRRISSYNALGEYGSLVVDGMRLYHQCLFNNDSFGLYTALATEGVRLASFGAKASESMAAAQMGMQIFASVMENLKDFRIDSLRKKLELAQATSSAACGLESMIEFQCSVRDDLDLLANREAALGSSTVSDGPELFNRSEPLWKFVEHLPSGNKPSDTRESEQQISALKKKRFLEDAKRRKDAIVQDCVDTIASFKKSSANSGGGSDLNQLIDSEVTRCFYRVASVIWQGWETDNSGLGGKNGDSPFPLSLGYLVKWSLLGEFPKDSNVEDSEFLKFQMKESFLGIPDGSDSKNNLNYNFNKMVQDAELKVENELAKHLSAAPATVLLDCLKDQGVVSGAGNDYFEKSACTLMRSWVDYLNQIKINTRHRGLRKYVEEITGEMNQALNIIDNFLTAAEDPSVTGRRYEDLVSETIKNISGAIEKSWGQSYLRTTLQFVVEWDVVEKLSGEKSSASMKNIFSLHSLSILSPYFRQFDRNDTSMMKLRDDLLDSSKINRTTLEVAFKFFSSLFESRFLELRKQKLDPDLKEVFARYCGIFSANPALFKSKGLPLIGGKEYGFIKETCAGLKREYHGVSFDIDKVLGEKDVEKRMCAYRDFGREVSLREYLKNVRR